MLLGVVAGMFKQVAPPEAPPSEPVEVEVPPQHPCENPACTAMESRSPQARCCGELAIDAQLMLSQTPPLLLHSPSVVEPLIDPAQLAQVGSQVL